MTREEFRNYVDFLRSQDEISYDVYSGLIDGIDTLEQEPCDVFDKYGNYKYPSDVELTEPNTATSMPCEDAISRKALISHIENQSREWGEDYDAQQILGDIEDMPPIKPQTTGHWIKDKEPWGGMQGWKCDKCNHTYDINVVYSKMPYNFCPKCGAKMIETQERSEDDNHR